ncbi:MULTISPECIES: DUF6068 family protein [Corallococcus]|uniref:DUF6068 family protein n=1 Tax=Corallococcus TaxID=83461 RepID=UPI00117E37CB|nr:MULTISPECIES: DUF6068 family protein [Corallococcus]NBD10485.1 hypothetical protein [Corallococcus silvisoli]TSC27691.1 hypothetical protein FOF48_20020 [Corallococcus sp. Z5C101001]
MHRTSFRPFLLCAALALGTSCESMKPRATSPANGTTATEQPDVAPPPIAVAQQEDAGTVSSVTSASPWQRARVGDRVEYAFSAHRGRPGAERGAGVAGHVSLEVVAVQAPWAWLTVTFTDDQGKPLPHPRLSQPRVLPMRMEQTQPWDTEHRGQRSTEQTTAAGRDWDAQRFLDDRRPSDGPLENRLYATKPGPLYLTHGLLDASTTLSGFGVSGSQQLTLVSFRQGTDAVGALPALERPWGPGTWYDVRQDVSGTPSVRRVCLGAERGFLLRKEATGPTGDAPCANFLEAEATPLEEALLTTVSEAIRLPRQWPPVAAGTPPARRETFTVGQHPIPAVVFEAPLGEGLERRAQVATYAAEPWGAALHGLADEARFTALSETVFRAPAKGPRVAEDGASLAGWGRWVVDGGK